MSELMHPVVCDIYAGNDISIADFRAMHNFGIRGVIHKASEGGGYADKMFRLRRDQILSEGMLLGAYHWANRSANVRQQVDFFLTRVFPNGHDNKTLLALDWEDDKRNGTMTVDQVHEWCTEVFKQTGQRPVIYSGNTAKEALGNRADLFLGMHRLWIPSYTATVRLQASWQKYFLWQYTGDGLGPLYPHVIPGLRNDDLDVFGGKDLAAEWVINTDYSDMNTPAPAVSVPAVPPVKQPEPSKPVLAVNPTPTKPIAHKPAPAAAPTFAQKAWDWFKSH